MVFCYSSLPLPCPFLAPSGCGWMISSADGGDSSLPCPRCRSIILPACRAVYGAIIFAVFADFFYLLPGGVDNICRRLSSSFPGVVCAKHPVFSDNDLHESSWRRMCVFFFRSEISASVFWKQTTCAQFCLVIIFLFFDDSGLICLLHAHLFVGSFQCSQW